MPPELPPDRIVTLDRRIFGAHTLPHKNILATAPDHIVLPYISYIGMYRQSGRVFAPFWSENENTLCPFWSGIGYGFRGNYGSV